MWEPPPRERPYRLLLNLLREGSAKDFLKALPAMLGAGMDPNETDADGWTLFQHCRTDQLSQVRALVEAGANPSAGCTTGTMRDCPVEACVACHPFWYEVNGDCDKAYIEYFDFLLELVSSGRMELPPPCRCVPRSSCVRVMMLAVRHAQRTYYEGLSRRLLLQSSCRKSPLPREIWLGIVLPYVHSGRVDNWDARLKN